MSTSTIEQEKPTPAAPDKVLAFFQSLYVMYYRIGNSLSYDTYWFRFNGNLTQAIQRGRDHCTRTNKRFLKVRPFLTDLDLEEQNVGKED